MAAVNASASRNAMSQNGPGPVAAPSSQQSTSSHAGHSPSPSTHSTHSTHSTVSTTSVHSTQSSTTQKPSRAQLGAPIQIVAPRETGGFQLQQEALESILLRPDVRHRHVVVLSVAGAFRKGKSFLLDFILRYLQFMAGGGVAGVSPLGGAGVSGSQEVPGGVLQSQRSLPGWLGDENRPLEGFHCLFTFKLYSIIP